MTSSKWKFSALLAICARNSPVPGEFPAQRPVTRSFYIFFDLQPNKQLSKKLWCWWFETPSCPLWRHPNDCCILISTSLKFIPKSSINNKTTVAEIMVWCRIGNKVLSDPKATCLSSICIYVPHEFTYIKYIYLHIHKLPNLPFFYWLCAQSPIYQKPC